MEQSLDDTSKSHYSFGDNRLAALRLEYLAAAFAPSSRRFLQGAKPARVELALDLGSAIGATTALVRDVTNAPHGLWATSGPETFSRLRDASIPTLPFETSTFCLRHTRIAMQT